MDQAVVGAAGGVTGGGGGGPVQAVRVVLLAGEEAMHCYGSVLRRFSVGLLDEVGELTLVCPEGSVHLEHLPSPPLRLVTESVEQGPGAQVDVTGRRVRIGGPYVKVWDRMRPGRRAERIAGALRGFKPTLIHALGEGQIGLARRLGVLLEVPYVVSLLALERQRGGLVDERCAALLCANSALARRLRRQYPRLEHRVHILPIGTHVPGEACCFRREGGLPVVLSCGRYERGSGLSGLIRAVGRLHEGGRGVQLVLAGSGKGEHRLRGVAREAKVEEYVHFVPPMERVLSVVDASRTAFRDADIYVQAGRSRQWAPELLEAMSVGCAVVAVDSEANDLIVPGRTAMCVEGGDVGALAEAMGSLVAQPERARELAGRAQGHLRKHFLASRMVGRLARTYWQALERGKG